jgi:chromosome partitioning protein
LSRALDRLGDDDVAVVDTPPGHDRLLAKALDYADVVVLPTRVGGVEAPRVDAVLAMIPRDIPVGLVVCSARTYTRDYQDLVGTWSGTVERVWGSVPERVTIAQGPLARLAHDGLEAYRPVWRRAQRAARGG